MLFLYCVIKYNNEAYLVTLWEHTRNVNIAFERIAIHIKTIWEHVSIIPALLSKRLMCRRKFHI